MPDPEIREIIARLVVQAERYDQAIESIQLGHPIDQDWLAGPHVVLLNAPPGMGKTHSLVEAAEAVGLSLPCLHLGPTHKSFDNVNRHPMWGHWKGHDDTCIKSLRAKKGYTRGRECTCQQAGPPEFNGVPSFAPVDYILDGGRAEFQLNPIDLMFPAPLAQTAERYPWWAIDDVGLDRFIGTLEITQRDLQLTAEHYPHEFQGGEAIRILACALLDVLNEHTAAEGVRQQPESWAGLALYDRLNHALQGRGSSIRAMSQALTFLQPSTEPWPDHQDDPHDWPCNFMPVLRRKLVAEMSAWYLVQHPGIGDGLETGIVHPHLHTIWGFPEDGGPIQSVLRYRWLRRPSLLRPTLIMDATADIDLLKRVFQRPGVVIEESAPIEVPPFPIGMKVTQHLGAHIGVGTLNDNFEKYGQFVRDELAARRASWTGDEPPKVGLITFKRFRGEFEKVLTDAGFDEDHWVMDHYWNVRGSNDFSSCDFMVMVGYPNPNPQGLYEEACVLFSNDADAVDRERAYFDRSMQLRNGHTLLIPGIPGYADSRLQALYEQKSLSELYQAFHRARPYAQSSVREVLVFTDVPINGVPVDGFFGREGAVFATLSRLLEEGTDVVTLPALVTAVLQGGMEGTGLTLDRWIRRNSDWLAQAVGAWFVGGSGGGNPGVFRKVVVQAIALENPDSDSHLDAALAYARAGLAVLPLRYPIGEGKCSCRKVCGSIGKHPHTRNGYKDATTDEATISACWARWPNANIGIATGMISGLVVLDVDPRNGGDTNLEQLEVEHGPLPDTWKVATGGGGSHYYFAYPTHVAAVKSTPHAAGQEGVEVKSDKGYVVAPPSLHESGALYEWEANQGTPSADLPGWMIAPPPVRAGNTPNAVFTAAAADLDAIQEQGAAQGDRDNAAMRLVGRWVAQGELDAMVLAKQLLVWNQQNKPPIGAADDDPDPVQWALDKVRSVLRMESRKSGD